MRCEKIEQHLADFLAGEAGSVTGSIQSHLATCDRCRSELENLEALWNKLGELPGAQPDTNMRARFQVMLDAYDAGLAAPAVRVKRGGAAWIRSLLRPSFALQFGCALVLLVLGGLVGHLLPFRNGDAGEMSQLREEIHNMRELVAISLLQQDSATGRLQGVSWSRLVPQPDNRILDALVAALDHDPSVNVRLAAVDALYRFSDRPAARQGLMEALLKQNSPLVQIALIDTMVELREKQSADVLRKLSSDKNVDQVVRDRARWGLQQLS